MSQDLHPTKMKILQAATLVFGEKGFNGTTTKEIAQGAGIAEGSLFRHFSSKQEILYGVVENIILIIGSDSLETLFAEIEDLPAEEALRRFIADRLVFFEKKSTLLHIILTEIQYDPQLREIYLTKALQPMQQLFSSFFAQRIKNGEFRALNPKVMVEVLSCVIFNATFRSLYPVNTEELTDILLYGFMKR